MTMINRRTLAKGTLWAAPIVATTAAVPALAASVACPIARMTYKGNTLTIVFNGPVTAPTVTITGAPFTAPAGWTQAGSTITGPDSQTPTTVTIPVTLPAQGTLAVTAKAGRSCPSVTNTWGVGGGGGGFRG